MEPASLFGQCPFSFASIIGRNWWFGLFLPYNVEIKVAATEGDSVFRNRTTTGSVFSSDWFGLVWKPWTIASQRLIVSIPFWVVRKLEGRASANHCSRIRVPSLSGLDAPIRRACAMSKSVLQMMSSILVMFSASHLTWSCGMFVNAFWTQEAIVFWSTAGAFANRIEAIVVAKEPPDCFTKSASESFVKTSPSSNL